MSEKILALLCAAALTLTALSCAKPADSDGTPAADTTAAAETAVNDSDYSDYASQYLNFTDPSYPDADFEGRGFNVLTYYEMFKDEETGDVMDDALIKTVHDVEDRLNIVVTYTALPSIVDVQPELLKIVSAGDEVYDLAINHCIHAIPSLLSDTLIYDWNRVDSVDFSKSYWNQSLNEALSIKGVLPIACGNFFMTSPMAIFFNKSVATDYSIDDIYATVNGGQWTLDRFCETAKLVSGDLNGDGKSGVEDLYGMISMADYQFMGFLAGCNQFVVEKDEEDFPTVALDNEKTLNIYGKLYSLIYESSSAFVWKYGSDASVQIPFSANTSLFYVSGGLGEAESLRSMETDFGIIPFPKYDEQQESYMSFELGSFLMIPLTAADKELSGMTSELLNAFSRRQRLPLYVDKLLVGKVARDNESEQMVYMILDSVVYDFGVNLGAYTDLSYILGFTLRDRIDNFTSYVASRVKSTNKHYETVYNSYLKYLEAN